MMVIVSALVLLTVAFVCHVAWWRIAWPGHTSSNLLALFLLVMALGFSVTFILGWSKYIWFENVQVVQTACLYLAGMAAYINTYPAIEAESPSLVLSRIISNKRSISQEELRELFPNSIVILPQIELAIQDGMIYRATDGALHLTQKGRVIGRLFLSYRKLVQRPPGG